jgi:HAD superfamily hydrolase (TIGR01509 family)
VGRHARREIVATLSAQQGLVLDAEAVAHRKELMYYELLPQLQAVPEVLEQITHNFALGAARIPMAVVSGGTRDSVTRSLTILGILDRFETLVCAEDYTRSKPDPEPFLVGAQRLGIAPKDCLVFEDTEMGIQSATAAGMASVKILQPWERVK